MYSSNPEAQSYKLARNNHEFRPAQDSATLDFLNFVVHQSIKHAQLNKGKFTAQTPNFIPDYIIETLQYLFDQGLSRFDPNPHSRLPKKNYVQRFARIACANTLRAKARMGSSDEFVDVSGSKLQKFMKENHPEYYDSRSGLVFGSAVKPCPIGYDKIIGKELADRGRILVTGGAGIEGLDNAMGNTCEMYLENGGKLVIVVITEDLYKTELDGVFHTENSSILIHPDHIDRIQIVTTSNKEGENALTNRLAAFHALNRDGEFYMNLGGNGTLAEYYAMMMQIMNRRNLDVPEKVIFSPITLWDKLREGISREYVYNPRLEKNPIAKLRGKFITH